MMRSVFDRIWDFAGRRIRVQALACPINTRLTNKLRQASPRGAGESAQKNYTFVCRIIPRFYLQYR